MFWRVFLEFVLFFGAVSLAVFFALGFFRYLFSVTTSSSPPPQIESSGNLQNLSLNDNMLQELTGVKSLHYLQQNKELTFFGVFAGISLVLTSSCFVVLDNNVALAAFIMVILTLIGIGAIFFYRQQHRQKRYRHLFALLQEVDNFNNTIKNIYVLDQLQAAGNPVNLSERDAILEALTIIRVELVRALTTEKILRENPTFNPEQFHCDLSTLHALQVNKETSEYGKLLDIALQVGLSVHDKMRAFIQERHV